MQKPVIFDEIIVNQFAKDKKLQPFRVKQVFYEIFKNQNISLNDMTTLSKDLRQDLSKEFDVLNLEIDQTLEDNQTTKFSFKTFDGFVIEAVLMYHWSKRVK